jgi:threonine/homoserine/homoserine lactone efflux protein
MPDFETPADIVMPVLGIVLYVCLFVYALGVLYSTHYIQKLRKKGLKFDEWLPLFFLVFTLWFAVRKS